MAMADLTSFLSGWAAKVLRVSQKPVGWATVCQGALKGNEHHGKEIPSPVPTFLFVAHRSELEKIKGVGGFRAKCKQRTPPNGVASLAPDPDKFEMGPSVGKERKGPCFNGVIQARRVGNGLSRGIEGQ